MYDDKNPDWVPTLNLAYDVVSCDPKRYERAKLREVKWQRLDQEMQDEKREVVEDVRETGTYVQTELIQSNLASLEQTSCTL